MDISFRISYSMLYDVCQILAAKTNPEGKWIKSFVLDGQDHEDVAYIGEILDKVPDVDQKVYLFSNLEIKDSSLLSECFGIYLSQNQGDCSVEGFCEFLKDNETISKILYQFYFNAEAEDQELMEEVCYKSDMSSAIRALLYEYIRFNDSYMDQVVESILHTAQAIKEIYDQRLSLVVKAQEAFDFGGLLQQIKGKQKKHDWNTGLEKIYISFSLCNRYLLLREKNGKVGWYILGIDYERALHEIYDRKVDLAVFGNALGDPMRFGILKAVIQNKELTISEITKSIGGATTTTLYHIDVLKKANLLMSRNKGRKVIYWANERQLQLAMDEIDKLLKGEIVS